MSFGALEKIVLTIFMILGIMFSAIYAIILIRYGSYDIYPIELIVGALMIGIVIQGFIAIYLILTQNSDLITILLDKGFNEITKKE